MHFSDDPLDVAFRWHSLGATRLHVIDLDGAETGELKNIEIIKQIAAVSPIEVGGGIRSMEAIESLLKINVDRVILGTITVEKPKLVEEACHRFGEIIVAGIDVRDGQIAIRGWQQQTELNVIEYAKYLVQLGVKRFIFTDISRDGTLTEPNFTQTFELIENIRLPVIASGGIASLTHLKIMDKLGAEGTIVGKALYMGNINLKQALAAVNRFE
jgi:phosphoribosylformimino-5-aminoimidazole carboxamide ribotide isomerase